MLPILDAAPAGKRPSTSRVGASGSQSQFRHRCLPVILSTPVRRRGLHTSPVHPGSLFNHQAEQAAWHRAYAKPATL